MSNMKDLKKLREISKSNNLVDDYSVEEIIEKIRLKALDVFEINNEDKLKISIDEKETVGFTRIYIDLYEDDSDSYYRIPATISINHYHHMNMMIMGHSYGCSATKQPNSNLDHFIETAVKTSKVLLFSYVERNQRSQYFSYFEAK